MTKAFHSNQIANKEVVNWIKYYLQSSDKSFLAKVYESYKQQIFFHCLNILKEQNDAKDLASDAFIKAFEKIRTFNLNKSFYPWLAQIATNLCIDFIRRKKIVQFDQIENNKDLSNSDDPVHDIENIELQEKIKDAIRKLKQNQKRCFCLFYIHEKPYKEIVKITGFSENEVRSYIQNGKRKIKLILEKEKIGENVLLSFEIIIFFQICWQTTLIINNLMLWG